ncbi:DNA primase/polymerase [Erwinia phage AH03]|uniref:DNA primase/polymerase n=1 Tax=Erwinia phage AH03 TaxID=2869568 RepID=A0AAE7X1I7_9CAUD|nr:DNA primase/polymerase [Erwinia phage AH03]
MFDRIPEELKTYKQWINWRYEDRGGKKPTKIPYNPINGNPASVTDSTTWASFEEAVAAAENKNMCDGIGFVFTDNDPYAFIDFDAPDESTKEDHSLIQQRQIQLFNEFNSYAERSPSGNGLHIIIKGKILSGRRRSCIEIYSTERYATFTGDVYRDAPIVEHNELLNVLYKRMGEGRANSTNYGYYADVPQTEEDSSVLETALAAVNGDKFEALLRGPWQDYYPSQSEADFAFVDIIAFYTQNREQIKRIFRNSQLGQRDKAKRDDYVAYMLNKCFDRMLPPVDIDGLRNQMEEALARLKEKETEKNKASIVPVSEPLNEPPAPIAEGSVYTVPPGLVGDVARFVYSQAYLPAPEIALAAAIGLIAGIVGRSYNISGTGLNQYILLLAPTGNGKESMAGGIDKLMAEVKKTVPTSDEFMGPGSIASPQALIKHLANTSPSFLTVLGEFGLELQMMSSPFAPDHKKGLLKLMLDLYNKSGEGKLLRASIYSDKEKNTSNVTAPGFTMMGESTPETFYAALNESMITSGLVPRFTIIEYHGKRPERNVDHMKARPGFDLIEKMSALCAHSAMLNNQNKAIHVETNADAQLILDSFYKHCDDQINASDKEVRRHLWNRAHVKALKLAALVAAGNSPYHPVIDSAVASWAINIIVADVKNILNRFDAGEIGIDNDENNQLKEIIRVIRDYHTQPWSEVCKYSTSPIILHSERIVPFSYIQRRCGNLTIFRKDKRGASAALAKAMQTLCDRGDVSEVSKATMKTKYGTAPKSYMVEVPRVFDI